MDTDTTKALRDELAAARAALEEFNALNLEKAAAGPPPAAVADANRAAPAAAALKAFLMGETPQREWIERPPELITKALEWSTDGTAGVPHAGRLFTSSLYPEIITSLLAASAPLEAGATIVATPNDSLQPLLVPVLSTEMTAMAHAELDDAVDAGGDITAHTLTGFRADGLSVLTEELIRSAGYDLPGFIGKAFGRAIAAKTAEWLAAGGGTTEPSGIITATTGKTCTSKTVLTPQDLIDLYLSTGKAYQKIGSYVVSSHALAQMLAWRDDSGGAGTGQFLLDHDEAGRLTFLGRPVFVEPNLNGAGAALADGDTAAVFGDFSGFWVRVSEVHIRADQGGADFPKFITRLAMAAWIDSVIVDPLALRACVMAV